MGWKGRCEDIVTDPEYLDVTVPAGATFTHPVRKGQNAFAYVIEGEGYFDQGRDSYGHEVIGANYFDFKRSCICKDETVVLYGDGGEVSVTSETKGSASCLFPAGPSQSR